MSEFFASFVKTIEKLVQMQIKEPPAVLLEAAATVMRFFLLGTCIATVVFAVQLGISLCAKKQRKNAAAIGAVLLVCVIELVWAFVPFSAAPDAAADSAALQTLHYISTKELAAQEAAAQAESEAAQAAAAPAPAEGEGEAVPAQAPADANTTGGATSDTSEAQDEEEENPLVDDALHRIVSAQTELTDQQAANIVKLLNGTQCTRTLRMSLPQKNAKNVLLRLENGRRWQVLLLEDEAYVYATEKTGFLCKVQDYKTFSKQLQTILKHSN